MAALLLAVGLLTGGCTAGPEPLRVDGVRPVSTPESSSVPIAISGFFPARVYVSYRAPERSTVDTIYRVWLGDQELPAVSYEPTSELTAIVPSTLAARAYDLRIISPAGQSATLRAAFTVLPPVCGDGVLNGEEVCDEGEDNDTGEGYCASPCDGWQICGDGRHNGTEPCDDGFRDSCGTCNADCTGVGDGAACGDGVRCPELEACDDGYVDACGTCNADCTDVGQGAVCGEGVRCPELEVCDDGYIDACGTCNADCTAPGTGSTCGDAEWCPEREACDGDLLGGATCTDFGWAPTAGLRCDADCALDLSGCTGPCTLAGDPDWDGVCNGRDQDDDDDGCADGLDDELSSYATLEVLFAGRDADEATPEWDPQPSDEAIHATMVAMGHTVTPFLCTANSASQKAWDDAIDPDGDAVADYDVLFVSESCAAAWLHDGASSYLNSLAIGILVTAPEIWDEMHLSPANTSRCLETIDIIDADHFITAPRGAGAIDIFEKEPVVPTPGGNCVALTDCAVSELAPGVRGLAADPSVKDHLGLFVIDTGAALLAGTTPDRRVGFGPVRPQVDFIDWTGATKSLLYRSLLWAAHRERDHDYDGDLVGDDCDSGGAVIPSP